MRKKRWKILLVLLVILIAGYFILPRFVWISHGYIGFNELQEKYGQKIKNPVFSIILPTYNRAAYLPRAITSVQGQTFTDFELIIVDDGSTDNTKEVVRRFQENDPRIIYIDSGQNYGVSHARNLALQAAKGKYVVMLDSDDMFFPPLLATEYKFFRKHPEIDVLAVKPYKIEDDGSAGGRDYPTMNTVMFLFNNEMVHIGAAVRKSFLEQSGVIFDESWHTTEDYKFYADLLMKGAKFHMIDQFLVGIRYHHTNTNSYYDEMAKHAEKVNDLMKEHFSPQTNNVCSYVKEIDGKFEQFDQNDVAKVKFLFCSGDYANRYYILRNENKPAIILLRQKGNYFCEIGGTMCGTVEAKDETAESICLTIKWDHAEQEERFCQVVTGEYWAEQ
ncbi:MAG: glycosyltransferase family 2 protein [Alphaproteobacteria bacterium]|nr:glycosyltransferase family 2 protein [Alphaproteobacteria bacterium]